jgi:iron complex transport system substrate-binding protein
MTRERVTLWILLALSLSLAILLSGCTGATDETPAESRDGTDTAAFPVTVTDDAGRQVTIEDEPERIVSLAPGNTEIVAALGLVDSLVGVTTYDDYPPEVLDLPQVGDFVAPNLEAVAAAEPDVVFATTGIQAEIIEQLEATGAVVVAVDPADLESLFASIEMVGAALGEADRAQDLTAGMRAEIDEITQAAVADGEVTVFIEIAQNPLFKAGKGTLLDDLIGSAGGTNVVGQEGYVAFSAEELLTLDPGHYLATMGSMSDPSELAARPGYDALTAVRDDRVTILDDDLVSRPGPRVVDGVRQIAAALHPDAF